MCFNEGDDFLQKNKTFLFSLLFLLCSILIFSYYVYAEKSIEYDVNESQIQCIFESEQVILKNYELSIQVDDLAFIDIGDVNNAESIFVDKVEENTINSLNEMKVEIYEEEYYTNNRLASRNVTSEIGSFEETHNEKLYRIFGAEAKYKDGRKLYYKDEAEALTYMTSFKVKVWDLDEFGNWYQREQWLTSHYTLEATLKCIFNDLLELPEVDRVPIKSMGCYHYREGSSAHTCGAAIDINWEENAEMTIDGVITCGYFWKPYENIYSIKADSPFVHIFEKYGWTWGGYWTSKKDYMHFSYIDR